MSPSTIALAIICVVAALGAVVGFLARAHHRMDLEQWTVGGRGFGLVFVWLLMAGEIYTTFTFLGASGWAYSKGGPVLNILGFQPLMYVVSFFILPAVWEIGRKHKLQTQADFFQTRFNSVALGAFVALVGVVCIIPYLQIQLTGLGLIVEVASFGAIHRTPAMIIGLGVVAAFVLVSGVRGVAWVSLIKDVLLLLAAVFVGIAIPRIHFGGIGPMFSALLEAKPNHLLMPGTTPNLGHTWYLTTVLLMSCGFYMWPQYFAACYTAKSARVLRRNAVIMPLYSITMPLMFIVGFSAVLVLPNLPNGDLSLLAMVRKTFPPWFLGVVGGAGALTAMVTAAIQLLTGATLYAKNLFRPILAPSMTDQQVARVAKLMVLVLTVGAVSFAIYSSASLVSLYLLGTAGVAQFFPGVVLGLYSRRATARGVCAGIAVGISTAAILVLTGRDPYLGCNAGLIALCLNFLTAGVVSLLIPRQTPVFEGSVTPAS